MGSIDRSVVDALSDVGVSPEKARAVSDSIESAIDQRYALHSSQITVKSDLAELKLEIVREISKIHDRVSASNERMTEMKAELVKWMLGAMLAQTGLLFAALKLGLH